MTSSHVEKPPAPAPAASVPAEGAAPPSASGNFHLPAPCARVLPLFTALGEKAWVKDWQPQLLSGRVECGSVFRTHHAGRATTWIVVDYDPAAGEARYARLAEGSNMGLVEVRCRDEEGGSHVEVTYTLTGLDEEGRAFVRDFLARPAYAAMLESWRQALVEALAREG